MAQLPQNCYAGACSGGSFCMQNIRRLGLRARVNCSIQTTVVLAESSIPATLVRKLLLSWICPCRAVQNSTEHNTKFFLQLRLILTLKSELSVSVSWKTVRIYPLWLEGGGGRSRREKDWKYRLDSGSINVFIAKETGALNSSLLAYQRQHYPRRSKSNRSKPLLPRDWDSTLSWYNRVRRNRISYFPEGTSTRNGRNSRTTSVFRQQETFSLTKSNKRHTKRQVWVWGRQLNPVQEANCYVYCAMSLESDASRLCHAYSRHSM